MSDADPSAQDPRRVNAVPARRFFVAMLVKDIELIPAIADLVDNCIDGAKRLRPPAIDLTEVPGLQSTTQRYEGLGIDIVVDATHFEINDNCGGIPLQHARDYAFCFGRPEGHDGSIGEVGQFGVGMKRALFKLGSAFEITSVSAHDSFTLDVDVDKWVKDPDIDWSFLLEDYEEGLSADPADTGTNVVVSRLHPNISTETSDDGFRGKLLNELRLRHGEAVRHGLRITVNSVPVEEFNPELLVGDQFKPIYVERDITTDDPDIELKMRLYAGLVYLRDPDADDADAEAFREPPEAGWYLFCNERLLIGADVTQLTGWGDGMAAYHPQYRQFRGYVMLDGDSSQMPWTTTKTAVDEESVVFKQVRASMMDALQKVLTIMNRLKAERATGETEGSNVPALEAMRRASSAPLAALAPAASFEIAPPAPRPRRTPTTTANITYVVDRDDFNVVKAALGATSAAEVGRSTFDFFLAEGVSP